MPNDLSEIRTIGRPKGSRTRQRLDPEVALSSHRDPEMAALSAARRRRANLAGEWQRACLVFTLHRVAKPKTPKRTLETPRADKAPRRTFAEREQRNQLVRAMRETHRVVEIAAVTGYSRQRIHQILTNDRYYYEVKRVRGQA